MGYCVSATVDALVGSARGYVLAPAGYGKTEAIARAIARDSDRRHLVLTHTHAGVHALTARLRKHGVTNRQARVDTIAGFCLRWAASYPATSQLVTTEPHTTADWLQTYEAAERLLTTSTIAQAVRASYDSIYVDEYQDCTKAHHALVLALAELRPVRILGDPLQGIFYFGNAHGDPIVDWDTQVLPTFERLPPLDVPHRWRTTNSELGEWLADARTRLIAGQPLDLHGAPIRLVPPDHAAAVTECRRSARQDGRTAAIIDLPPRAHRAAKNLGGLYDCMEPMACDDLIDAAARLEASSGSNRALALIDVAAVCMSNTTAPLKSARSRFARGDQARLSAGAANREALSALNAVVTTGGPIDMLAALDQIGKLPKVKAYRHEFLRELRRTFRYANQNPDVTLPAAAWRVREITRRRGRPPMDRTVTRPLLVKGLEVDHAVLLDAGSFSDPRDLYVSLTRGSRSLTLIGTPKALPPRTEAVFTAGA